MKKQFCRLRKDLAEQDLGVPIGDDFHFLGNTILEYRWDDDDDDAPFEVFIGGSWQVAYSIDFEFVNEEVV